MSSKTMDGLVAFRCLGRCNDLFYDTLRAFRFQGGDAHLELAVLGDAGELSAEEYSLLTSLVDHALLHSVPQGLGRTNKLAIAQARINQVNALVIIDGDGIYAEAVEAVSTAIRALGRFNVVVSRQSLISLPIADRPGEDRLIYEHFERWLLERRFGCKLPEQLQPGLYALDRQAIATIELTCRHFAADWEIVFRALEAGLSIGPTDEIAKTREQATTSFREEHQREKFTELFSLLDLSRREVDALVEAFVRENGVDYNGQRLKRLQALCISTFENV